MTDRTASEWAKRLGDNVDDGIAHRYPITGADVARNAEPLFQQAMAQERALGRAEMQERVYELEHRLAVLTSDVLPEDKLAVMAAEYHDSLMGWMQKVAELQQAMDDAEARGRDAGLVRALREALLDVAGCKYCDPAVLGVWEWDDEDGIERVCDEHKDSHFYAHGPFLNDKLRAASDALRNSASAQPTASEGERRE